MENLEDMGDLRDVLIMRSVAKAWHTAFRDYYTAYDFVIPTHRLPQFMDIKPNVESLDTSGNYDHTIKLNPLMAAPNLASLIVNGNTFQDASKRVLQPRVKLSKLPPSLRFLNLNAVYADPAYFPKIAFTDLRSLGLFSRQNTNEDTVDLLRHLPALEVPTVARIL